MKVPVENSSKMNLIDKINITKYNTHRIVQHCYLIATRGKSRSRDYMYVVLKILVETTVCALFAVSARNYRKFILVGKDVPNEKSRPHPPAVPVVWWPVALVRNRLYEQLL